jgi:hypothetical protein
VTPRPLTAADFETPDGDRTWPFFETDEGNIIGHDHTDPATFASLVHAYDMAAGLTPAEALDPDVVSHEYIRVTSWEEDEPVTFAPCTVDDEGAEPVTVVAR